MSRSESFSTTDSNRLQLCTTARSFSGQTQTFLLFYLLSATFFDVLSVRRLSIRPPGCSGGVAGSSDSETDALQMCVLAEKLSRSLKSLTGCDRSSPTPAGRSQDSVQSALTSKEI